MNVFLDFSTRLQHASILPDDVAWIFEDGRVEQHHIRADEADARPDGQAPAEVGRRLAEVLAEHKVFVAAPHRDVKFLQALMHAGGLPQEAVSVADVDHAHFEAAEQILAERIPLEHLEDALAGIVGAARLSVDGVHDEGALTDAQREREIWLEVQRLARISAASGLLGFQPAA